MKPLQITAYNASRLLLLLLDDPCSPAAVADPADADELTYGVCLRIADALDGPRDCGRITVELSTAETFRLLGYLKSLEPSAAVTRLAHSLMVLAWS